MGPQTPCRMIFYCLTLYHYDDIKGYRNEALILGKLGKQVVLVSKKAFENLSFQGQIHAEKNIYYPKFIDRDSSARNAYKEQIKKGPSYKDDIFVLDILREEMKKDDVRIQRILSE